MVRDCSHHRDPFECNCDCHSRPGVYHVRACCHKCGFCKTRIRGSLVFHTDYCSKNPINAGKSSKELRELHKYRLTDIIDKEKEKSE